MSFVPFIIRGKVREKVTAASKDPKRLMMKVEALLESAPLHLLVKAQAPNRECYY